MSAAAHVEVKPRSAGPAVSAERIAGLYVEVLEGGPGTPVLLSAGLGGSGHYWRPQLDALRQARPVILYDHRGTGRSGGDLPADYGIDDMGADIALILDGLGCGSAHVVGHAAGAMAALALATKRPELLASVTSVNGWLKPDPHFLRCFDIRLTLLEAGGPTAYAKAQPLFLYPPRWIAAHADLIDQEMAAQLASFPDKAILIARIDALRAADMTGRLDAIDLPAMVVASEDDMLVPDRCAEPLAAALSRYRPARLERLPYGGHAVNVTQAEAFNALLADFFETVAPPA
mgnify:CR=1 FL=1